MARTVYGYGLYSGDERARQYALTAGEGPGVAVLLDLGIKAAFGRLRPFEDNHDHNSFFHGGASFVSGDVAPMFALAIGISEYYNNRWEVALPIYSLALMGGLGRMGNDARWFSDVVGGALLGIGTTELFRYLHRQHEEAAVALSSVSCRTAFASAYPHYRPEFGPCRHDDRILVVSSGSLGCRYQ